MTDAEQTGSERWDTPCGVHHGYVFLAGFAAGLGVAASAAILVIPHV